MAQWTISEQSEKATNSKGKRTYERTWGVVYDLQSVGTTPRAYDVGSRSEFPEIGDVHPSDSAAYCTELSVDGGQGTWTVTAKYSDERTLDATAPENDEVLVEFDTEIYQEPVHKDYNDEAVQNSAGDPYVDPIPVRDASRVIARIQANVTSVPGWVIGAGNNQVNDSGITVEGITFPTGTVKTSRIKVGKREYRNGTKFYPLSFELHYRKEGWRLEPLDAGYRYRDAKGFLAKITNEGDDEEPTKPVPLDGSGGILTDPTPSTAVYGDHQIYVEADLSTLPGVT